MNINMLQDKTIIVAGGDLRQVSLAKLFSKNNKVYCLGLEQSNGISNEKSTVDELVLKGVVADYIIFPMPLSIDNNAVNTPFSSKVLLIDDVLSLSDLNTSIYGGKISPTIRQHLEHKNLWYLDYLEQEELAVNNAVPTAEGALQIAMEELATTVYGCNCLLVGFGRITKVLIPRLVALGANVTVSARKYSDLAWIEILGCKSIHTRNLCDVMKKKQLIINTVPATILNEDVLALTDENALIIDLASKPGGIDFDAAKKLGLKTIWALSLPGKVAPLSAGEIIFNTITNIELERSYTDE